MYEVNTSQTTQQWKPWYNKYFISFYFPVLQELYLVCDTYFHKYRHFFFFWPKQKDTQCRMFYYIHLEATPGYMESSISFQGPYSSLRTAMTAPLASLLRAFPSWPPLRQTPMTGTLLGLAHTTSPSSKAMKSWGGIRFSSKPRNLGGKKSIVNLRQWMFYSSSFLS